MFCHVVLSSSLSITTTNVNVYLYYFYYSRRFLVYRENDFLGVEVGTRGVLLRSNPHPLALGVDRLRSTQVSQHNVTVKVPLVNPLGRSVEAGATAAHPFLLVPLSKLPLIYVVFTHLGVKGNHRESGNLRQLVESVEEQPQHFIVHRTGLVNGDSDFRGPLDLLAGVNVREALVDSTDS